MLEHPLPLYLFLLCLLSSTFACADELNIDAVDTLVTGYSQPREPGISVAIARDGTLIYEGWSGLADLERRVPIDRRTRFLIASISKQFTAFAVHTLAAAGKLRLDQPLTDFFPQLGAVGDTVTSRHLLDHTGGLREVNTLVQLLGLSESAPVTAEQMLALTLRQKGANFPPGTDEEYSNTGYQLLAHIVARVSGQSFPDYLQAKVFKPMGMSRSFVRTDPNALIEHAALGYEAVGDDLAHRPVLATGIGATGMVSTPRDLVRWGHALNTAERAGDPVLQAMAERTRLPDGRVVVAGSGQEFRAFRGLKTWSHGGSTGGFRSFLLRLPEEGIVLAVVGNRADFLKAKFAFELAAVLLEDKLDPVPTPDLRPETLATLDRYVGDYRLFPGSVFSLRRSGEALTFATYGADDAFELPWLSRGKFLLNPSRDIRLVFPGTDGSPADHLRWQVSEDGYLRAERVELAPLPVTRLDLRRFTGSFYSTELQCGFDVVEQDGTLFIETRLHDAVPLVQYAPATFRPDGPVPFARLRFVTEGDAPARTINVAAPLAEGITFRRIEP
ncbi:MAG: serine hydrolase domain-containing protein [Pseudomonadota bacterium]